MTHGTAAFEVTEVAMAHCSARSIDRPLATEVPVALEYNGLSYAVMMATPCDLPAFALGFSRAEGIVDAACDILDLSVVAVDDGYILRMTVDADRLAPLLDRVRLRLIDGGCGLCGVESITQALRPLPPVALNFAVDTHGIARALQSLSDWQPMGRATGAMHCAAFCRPDGTILTAQEDVGRHNALDKLVGTLMQHSIAASDGFMLVSSRCSYELVEKAARAGCAMLVAISAPSTLASETARACGMTLIALARSDTMLVINDPSGQFAQCAKGDAHAL